MPAPPFLFLATPCYGGQVSIFFLRAALNLQAACEARGVGLHVELLENDALITRARARLAHRFLAHPQAAPTCCSSTPTSGLHRTTSFACSTPDMTSPAGSIR